MAKVDINNWARQFAEDLNGMGARIMFERLIALHLDELGLLRGVGLSWPAISGALALAGARRQDGNTFTSDQLRAAYSRVLKRSIRSSTPQGKSSRSVSARPIELSSDLGRRGKAGAEIPSSRTRSGKILRAMKRANALRKESDEF